MDLAQITPRGDISDARIATIRIVLAAFAASPGLVVYAGAGRRRDRANKR